MKNSKKSKQIEYSFYKEELKKANNVLKDFEEENEILKEEINAKNSLIRQIADYYIKDIDNILSIHSKSDTIDIKELKQKKKWLSDIDSLVFQSSKIIEKLENFKKKNL